MAMIFTEGFDYFNTTYWASKGWSTLSTADINLSGARRTPGGMGSTAGTGTVGYFSKNIAGTRNTVITGFAFSYDSSSAYVLNADMFFLRFNEGIGATHVSVGYNASNQLTVWRGDRTTVLATGPTLTLTNSFTGVKYWYYIDVEVTVSDTVGVVKVWLNDNLVIDLSGIDTRNGGTGIINTLQYGGGNSSNYWHRFDDMYCLDTTGTTNNAKIGDCRIDTLLPNGDASTTWTRNTGSTNFSAVNDTSGTNGDTTYVATNATNAQEIYDFTNNPSPSALAIKCVSITAIARKEDVSTANLRLLTKIGGTTYTGSSVALDSNLDYIWNVVQQIRETSPATSTAWTKTEVDGTQFGFERL